MKAMKSLILLSLVVHLCHSFVIPESGDSTQKLKQEAKNTESESLIEKLADIGINVNDFGKRSAADRPIIDLFHVVAGEVEAMKKRIDEIIKSLEKGTVFGNDTQETKQMATASGRTSPRTLTRPGTTRSKKVTRNTTRKRATARHYTGTRTKKTRPPQTKETTTTSPLPSTTPEPLTLPPTTPEPSTLPPTTPETSTLSSTTTKTITERPKQNLSTFLTTLPEPTQTVLVTIPDDHNHNAYIPIYPFTNEDCDDFGISFGWCVPNPSYQELSTYSPDTWIEDFFDLLAE